MVASFLVTLLLLQWGVGPAICLEQLEFRPERVLCGASHSVPHDRQDAHQAGNCPACSLIPPTLLPTPPDVPRPQPVRTLLGNSMQAAQPAPILPRITPQQPRAPPRLA